MVPAQPAVGHTHSVARAVDYTVLYTCDIVLQNPSSAAAIVELIQHILIRLMFTRQRGQYE